MAKFKTYICDVCCETLFESLRTGSTINITTVDGLSSLSCRVVKIEVEEETYKDFIIRLSDGEDQFEGFYDTDQEVGWFEPLFN